MNIYWTVLLAAFVSAFAVGESYALAKNKTTLSRFVWDLTKAWPPLPLIVGCVTGFGFAHFWWGGHFSCY